MKRILLLATAFFLAQTTYVPPKNVTNKAETYVYICTGPQSKRYQKQIIAKDYHVVENGKKGDC